LDAVIRRRIRKHPVLKIQQFTRTKQTNKQTVCFDLWLAKRITSWHIASKDTFGFEK